MHDLGNDTELDHISREAAGKYIVPGAPDWQKMEASLDKVLPVEKKRRLPLFWLLPVLLAGGAGYWLMASSSPGNNPIAITATENKTVAATAATRHTNPALADNQSTGTRKTLDITRQAPVVKSISSQERLVQKNRHPNNFSNPVAAESAGKPVAETSPGYTAKTNTPPATQQPVTTAGNNTVLTITPSRENPVIETASTPETGNPVPAQADHEKKITAEQENETPVTVSPRKKTPAAFGKGWSLSLTSGIDKSTVKFSYGNTPGINIGLLGGYHFNERWSVHTGAIFTQKNYKMAGSDFHAPKGSWASYYKLENVEGYCRMWEIPLLARYSFGHTGRKDYFISTGLSSYFMTSENYDYFYYQQGQPLTRHAALGGGKSHILSIAHVSAGFESRLTKTLLLQVEPYAKLPLQGIGFGSIQLSSFGVNFGLQVRQPSRH